MLIDRIYQKVKTFVNTEVRGNVTPAEFNLFLHDAIQSRYGDYIYEINRLQHRVHQGVTSNLTENLPNKIREKILHYLTETATPIAIENNEKYRLPQDIYFLDEVEYVNQETSETTVFEVVKNKRSYNITKSQATATYPICLQVGEEIRTSHNLGPLTISYLRKPKFGKWTYMVVNGAEIFNPGAGDFEDADIHPSEEDKIVVEVLMRFGINLKEQDIQASANSEDIKETNDNNLT